MLGTALYLTRPQDVQAHLIFAAMEIGQAILTLQGRQIYGTLGSPDPENGRVHFSVDHQLADLVGAPEVGRAVRVTYEHRDSAYAFFSEIEAAESPLAWVLQLPRTVERTDRRLVSRHDVSDEHGFEVVIHDGGELNVYKLGDVSSAGLSFYFDPHASPFQVAQRFGAALRLPGNEPIELTLEIRNSRPHCGGAGHIAGVSFVRLGPVERNRIAKALAVWRHGKRARR